MKSDESIFGSTFQIFNYAGLEVYFGRFSEETTQIDITDFLSGFFFIKFEAFKKELLSFPKNKKIM
jgi:hypothetical protein